MTSLQLNLATAVQLATGTFAIQNQHDQAFEENRYLGSAGVAAAAAAALASFSRGHIT